MISNDWQPEKDLLSDSLPEISVEGELRNQLRTIILWSRITAIGGFINMGLSVLVLFIQPYSILTGQTNVVSTFITLIISFFINYFLLNFSAKLKTGFDEENQEAFNEATDSLRSYMRMIGILMIVGISIMAIAFIVIVGTHA